MASSGGTSVPPERWERVQKDFEAFGKLIADTGKTGLDAEFMQLMNYERANLPSLVPVTPETEPLNRYIDIIPVESTNVVLQPESENDTTYINANELQMWTPLHYIAAQGPLVNTAGHFWRMVWQKGASVIVMATNLNERGMDKCFQYWPNSGQAVERGSLVIVCEDESQTSKASVVRTFKLTHKPTGEERRVTQLHFVGWPDQGVPTRTTEMATFVLMVDTFLNACPQPDGPLVVHCSAGIGRTGVFIAIHTLIRAIARWLDEGVVPDDLASLFDVQATMLLMRKQRMSMIQTPDQYNFVHTFLYEYGEYLINRTAGASGSGEGVSAPPLPLEAAINAGVVSAESVSSSIEGVSGGVEDVVMTEAGGESGGAAEPAPSGATLVYPVVDNGVDGQ